VTGILLIIFSCFTPTAMDSILTWQAKKSSQLTKENEDDWKDIPGSNDIGIYWRQYFYNCSNAEDVVYTGAKPEFEEFGPYTYREWDSYTDVSWSNL